MFRERTVKDEVKISHDLSGKINLKKNDRHVKFDDEFYMDLRIEMKYA